jgi:hypothetical protein
VLAGDEVDGCAGDGGNECDPPAVDLRVVHPNRDVVGARSLSPSMSQLPTSRPNCINLSACSANGPSACRALIIGALVRVSGAVLVMRFSSPLAPAPRAPSPGATGRRRDRRARGVSPCAGRARVSSRRRAGASASCDSTRSIGGGGNRPIAAGAVVAIAL